jgi:hypothetical protein
MTRPPRLTADKNILRYREVRENSRMLVNYGDTLVPSVSCVQNRRFHAIFQNPPTVRLMDASKDFDQRAFASPVLAGERMYPSCVKAQIDITQYLDRPKALGDPAKLDYRASKLHLRLVSFRFHTQVTALGS